MHSQLSQFNEFSSHVHNVPRYQFSLLSLKEDLLIMFRLRIRRESTVKEAGNGCTKDSGEERMNDDMSSNGEFRVDPR